MYAVTEIGFRTISSAGDIQPGEYLWDQPSIPMHPWRSGHALKIVNGVLLLKDDADLLVDHREVVADALRFGAETRIDAGIQPVTREMLRDGVLAEVTAEAVREFIAATYEAVNAAIDLIAVAVEPNVDDVAPAWPTYEGPTQ